MAENEPDTSPAGQVEAFTNELTNLGYEGEALERLRQSEDLQAAIVAAAMLGVSDEDIHAAADKAPGDKKDRNIVMKALGVVGKGIGYVTGAMAWVGSFMGDRAHDVLVTPIPDRWETPLRNRVRGNVNDFGEGVYEVISGKEAAQSSPEMFLRPGMSEQAATQQTSKPPEDAPGTTGRQPIGGGLQAGQKPSETPPPPPAGDGGPSYIGVPNTMGVRDPETGDVVQVPFRTIRTIYEERRSNRGGLVEGRFPTETVERVRAVSPRYLDGDEKQPSKFGIGGVEDRARLQLAMTEAGLLDPEDYRPGVWDEGSWTAFRDVLAHANVNGQRWDEALDALVSAPLAKPAGRDGDGRSYLAPDYATLAQQVKGVVRKQLDREPRDWELTILADTMSQLHRQEFDQEQAAAEYQAQIDAGIAQEEKAPPQQIDAKARFMEKFEELYGGELATERAEDEAGRTQQIATGVGNLMRSLIGGPPSYNL